MIRLRQSLFLGTLTFIKFSLFISIFLYTPSIFGERELRDPFYLPKRKSSAKKIIEAKLLGIVSSANTFGAIIWINGSQDTVFVGDKIGSFKVNRIGADFIVLEKGKFKRKLFIHAG